MHPAFREIDQKKPAITRSYNIPRLKWRISVRRVEQEERAFCRTTLD
jgi:hypothetical protein